MKCLVVSFGFWFERGTIYVFSTKTKKRNWNLNYLWLLSSSAAFRSPDIPWPSSAMLESSFGNWSLSDPPSSLTAALEFESCLVVLVIFIWNPGSIFSASGSGRGSDQVTNQIIFCWVFTFKDRCEKVRFFISLKHERSRFTSAGCQTTPPSTQTPDSVLVSL